MLGTYGRTLDASDEVTVRDPRHLPLEIQELLAEAPTVQPEDDHTSFGVLVPSLGARPVPVAPSVAAPSRGAIAAIADQARTVMAYEEQPLPNVVRVRTPQPARTAPPARAAEPVLPPSAHTAVLPQDLDEAWLSDWLALAPEDAAYELKRMSLDKPPILGPNARRGTRVERGRVSAELDVMLQTPHAIDPPLPADALMAPSTRVSSPDGAFDALPTAAKNDPPPSDRTNPFGSIAFEQTAMAVDVGRLDPGSLVPHVRASLSSRLEVMVHDPAATPQPLPRLRLASTPAQPASATEVEVFGRMGIAPTSRTIVSAGPVTDTYGIIDRVLGLFRK